MCLSFSEKISCTIRKITNLFIIRVRVGFMCGINGFTFQDQEKVKKMNHLLSHRGPDSSGIFSDDQVTLGHQRLKIIDLSEKAAQPMPDSEQKIWIVFNGEIYNFKEVRKELEDCRYKFNSDSDTEVIINAYQKWGYDCVNHFNGMWAFAIYDKEKNKIFLSRDRLGKKPLYYYSDDNKMIFSSEIKPLFVHNIEKVLNKKAVSSYLSYRYVLGEETMFENIFKLLPAHNMVYDLKEKRIEKIWEYWDVDNADIRIKEPEAKKDTHALLKDAISLRQVSDVPIGSINSGGLDSSVVSAIMATIHKEPIRTFTVKFPEKDFDETEFAQLLAEHCSTLHKEVTIDLNNFLEIMQEYSRKRDEPIGVPNEIALYALFQKIKQDVTVILSGEGADEIFAGYGRKFRAPFDYQRLKQIQKKGAQFYKKNYPSLYQKYKGKFFNNELEHFLFLYDYFPSPEKDFFLKPEYQCDLTPIFEEYFNKFSNNDPYVKKISYIFIKLHLPSLFARLDNSSMASAVEARCPFVDYRLVNFVFNLPFHLKNPWKSEQHKIQAEKMNCDEIAEKHDTTKYILKKISEDYIPPKIIQRKKQGFPLPLQKWFKHDLFGQAKKFLLSQDSKIKMIANQDNLNQWIEQGQKSQDKKFGQKLWMLLSLELWLREWF